HSGCHRPRLVAFGGFAHPRLYRALCDRGDGGGDSWPVVPGGEKETLPRTRRPPRDFPDPLLVDRPVFYEGMSPVRRKNGRKKARDVRTTPAGFLPMAQNGGGAGI